MCNGWVWREQCHHLSKAYKTFKDDTYEFKASKDLLMCMPFDFIDGLKDKNWTRFDHELLARLMKHLKKAQSSNIKQIRFIRHIWRFDIYDNSREYEIEDECYIYEVILENDLTHYVSFGQIHDIIGDEEWLPVEGNCLCNIASSWITSLSLGAKKKESTNLMLYASVKVIMLVWKIMENNGFILDILSALTRTPKKLLWSGKRHGKRTLFT